MITIIDWAIIFVYIALMFIIGITMYKRSGAYDDYLIAGRKFNSLYIALTLAAMISSATLGVSGLGYSFGLSGAWFFIMLGIGAWILFFTIAGRLRVLAQYAITDIYELRYDARCRVLITVLGVFAYITLLSIGFVGGGLVLNAFFGIPLIIAMLIIAIPFITYTALGGIWASAVTNIIKFLILIAGLAILIPTALSGAGGWEKVIMTLPPDKFNLFSSLGLLSIWAFFWLMTLSFWVAADIYQMLFAAKSVHTARVGLIFAGILIIIIGMAAAIIGILASVQFPGIQPEAAAPVVALTLPTGLSGLVSVALLSGSAIAVVIFQIVAATLLIRGIWPKVKMSMNKVRMISTIMGGAGLVVAAIFQNIILLVELTFRIMIPATFVTVLAAFYWKRATAAGAFASSLIGATVAVLWTFLALPWLGLNPFLLEPTLLEPTFIGVLASFIALIVVSYLSHPPPIEKLQLFISAKGSKEKS
ncbi:MAG: sodium:solute symporter family protein [Nitrososphaerales archaeon]